MLFVVVLCLLQGWAQAQSSSSSLSVSVQGHAPLTYTSSSGNAQALATASTATPGYYYQYPYNMQPPRVTRQITRNDASQQVTQRRLPLGLQRTPMYSASAPAFSAPAGITQSIAPVFLGRSSRLLRVDSSRLPYKFPTHSARGLGRSYVQVSPTNPIPYIYTPIDGLSQAAVSFAPPPPNSQLEGYYSGAHIIAAAPPAPAETSKFTTETLGSISSAISNAATAFAPPSPSGSVEVQEPIAPSSSSQAPTDETESNAEASGTGSTSSAPLPSSGVGEVSTDVVNNIAVEQAQTSENAPPPSSNYGVPSEEVGSFAGAQAQAAAAPSPIPPVYGPPGEEGGNFAGAQAQAAAAPPPVPPVYGLPGEAGGNFAGAQAQAAAAPPPPPPSPVYGLPSTNSEGGDTSILTVHKPHSEYGLPGIKKASLFNVDPIADSTDDVEKSYVFVPAFPEGKTPLSDGTAFSPPAPGGFNPPDGALLSPPVPTINNQPLPAPRNPLRQAKVIV